MARDIGINMLTKKDKQDILDAFKMIDVKKFEIDLQDQRAIKWFRFGNYNGMQVAAEIVKAMPEKKAREKVS